MNNLFYKVRKIFPSIFNDLDRSEIIKGTGATFFFKIGGLFFSYGFNIYLAKVYGAKIVGLFGITMSIFSIFALLSQMGTQTSVVRFIAQYAGQKKFEAVNEIYTKTLLWVLPLSFFFAGVLFFTSKYIANDIFHKPLLVEYINITAFVIPLSTIIIINSASLRGLKKIKEAFIFSTVLPPLLNIVGLIILTYFFLDNYLAPVYANFFSYIIGAIFSFFLWKKTSSTLTKKKNNINNNNISIKKIIKISAPMFLTSAVLLVMGITDTFIMGIFRSSSEVGIYRISLKLALFSSLTLNAVNSIAAPKYSEIFWQGDKVKLKKTVVFSSRVIFLGSLPFFVLLTIFSKQILGLFGSEFEKGATILVILSFAQLYNALCGSVGVLLNMAKYEKSLTLSMLSGSILNIILNFLLVPNYGMLGAATATLISTITWNSIALLLGRKYFGFWINYLPERFRK